MAKHRIVRYDGRYRIQQKFLFWWLSLTTLGDSFAEYDTVEEAEREIETLKRYEKENGTVVKEL